MSGSAADIRISFSWIDMPGDGQMVRLICTPSREGARSRFFGEEATRDRSGSRPVAYPQWKWKKEECASHGEHNPQRIGNRHVESDRSPAAASDAKGNAKKEGGSATSEGTASVSIHGASRGLDVSCSCVVWCGVGRYARYSAPEPISTFSTT